MQREIYSLVLNEFANGMYQMIDKCFYNIKDLLEEFEEHMKKYFKLKKFMKFELTDFGYTIFDKIH